MTGLRRDLRTPVSTGALHVDDRQWSAWSHLLPSVAITPTSFGVKDVIDVAGMPTACGYLGLEREQVRTDAPIVRVLRDQGWNPIGKTETAQFAYSDPAPSRSPYHEPWTPGGSSTGSAVAVACNHVRMALGTQTGGSIVRPASYCGVVGVKPSHGRLPIDGIRPLSPSIDTVGYLARDAGTAVEVGVALSLTTSDHWNRFATNTAVRIGELSSSEFTDEVTERGWHLVTRALTRALDPEPYLLDADLSAAAELHRQLLALESEAVHHERRASAGDDGYGPNLLELLELGASLRAEGVRPEQRLAALRDTLEPLARAVPDEGILLMPATVAQPPERAVSTGSSRFAFPWTAIGTPVVTVPWALASPVSGDPPTIGGVQVIASNGRDDTALAGAKLVEDVLRSSLMHPLTGPDDRNST